MFEVEDAKSLFRTFDTILKNPDYKDLIKQLEADNPNFMGQYKKLSEQFGKFDKDLGLYISQRVFNDFEDIHKKIKSGEFDEKIDDWIKSIKSLDDILRSGKINLDELRKVDSKFSQRLKETQIFLAKRDFGKAKGIIDETSKLIDNGKLGSKSIGKIKEDVKEIRKKLLESLDEVRSISPHEALRLKDEIAKFDKKVRCFHFQKAGRGF